MKLTRAALLLLAAGCIDFRKDLEDFCARTGRCAADGGTAGGSAMGGGTGGSGGGSTGGGGGAMGGGSGGGSGGGMDGGTGGGGPQPCTREACLDRNWFVSNTYIWTLNGSGPNDVWIGGGKLHRYDGVNLLERSDNPALGRTLFASSATAPDDVWIAGRTDPDTYRYDGTNWRSKKFDGGDTPYGLYARSTDDAFLVAGENIFHWDGGQWDFIYKNTFSETFYDVHGVPGSPVYAVANDVHVYRIDENLQVTVESPPTNGEDLVAINVSPTAKVWAVGTTGTVVRRGEDAGWERITIDVGGNQSTLNGVWVRNDDDVWMAGWLGTILHWRSDAGFTARGGDAFDGGVDLTEIVWQDAWGTGKHLWFAGTTGPAGFGDFDGGVVVHFNLP